MLNTSISSWMEWLIRGKEIFSEKVVCLILSKWNECKATFFKNFVLSCNKFSFVHFLLFLDLQKEFWSGPTIKWYRRGRVNSSWLLNVGDDAKRPVLGASCWNFFHQICFVILLWHSYKQYINKSCPYCVGFSLYNANSMSALLLFVTCENKFGIYVLSTSCILDFERRTFTRSRVF